VSDAAARSEADMAELLPLCLDLRLESDVLVAARRALDFASLAGFDTRGRGEVGIITSELASNAFKFAGGGRIELRMLSVGVRDGLEIAVEDDGPGIPSLGLAMIDGFSEGRMLTDVAPGLVRRRGLGAGLGAVQRLSDVFEALPRPEGGMRMIALKWLQDRR